MKETILKIVQEILETMNLQEVLETKIIVQIEKVDNSTPLSELKRKPRNYVAFTLT